MTPHSIVRPPERCGHDPSEASGPAIDKAAADEAAKDNAADDKSIIDKEATEDGAAADKKAAEDKAAADRSAADQAVKDKAAADRKAAEDKAAAERAAADKASKDKAAADKRAAEDKAVADKEAAKDKAAAERAAADKAAKDQAAADKKAAEDKAAAERAAADKAAKDKAAADKKAAEDKAAADKKAAEDKTVADKKAVAEKNLATLRDARDKARAAEAAVNEEIALAEREGRLGSEYVALKVKRYDISLVRANAESYYDAAQREYVALTTPQASTRFKESRQERGYTEAPSSSAGVAHGDKSVSDTASATAIPSMPIPINGDDHGDRSAEGSDPEPSANHEPGLSRNTQMGKGNPPAPDDVPRNVEVGRDTLATGRHRADLTTVGFESASNYSQKGPRGSESQHGNAGLGATAGSKSLDSVDS